MRFGAHDREEWVRAAERMVSGAELERAARLTDPEVKAQHVVGRAMVRILGGEATGLAPRDVAVAVTPERKPYLADFPDVHVSVAHTQGVVLVACLPGAQLGVDIESMDRAADGSLTMVRRRFAAREQEHFAALSPEHAAAAFVRYWTAKEAVGKALGVGLIPALRGAILESEGDGLRLLAVPAGPPAHEWTLEHLRAPDGDELIAVAIAAPAVGLGPIRVVQLHELPAGERPAR